MFTARTFNNPYCQKYIVSVTSSADNHIGKTLLHKNVQHTIVYCWLKLVVNYMYSTHFVFIGILETFFLLMTLPKMNFILNKLW